jgi:alpha-glucosidase
VSERWWSTPVIYQVYWRSFLDGNGDGVGDLAGLNRSLDHLTSLGVDGLWLNPMFPSPQRDHGYDVADYQDVEPMFGDLGAFEAFLKACHERGMFVLLDIVPNHCSSDHEWFQTALSDPNHPWRSRFHWMPGRGPDGSMPPNDWESIFGGPAWTQITERDGTPGPWYLHMFDPGQPELNWDDPEVWTCMEDSLRFWFDRGVDGFRIDVAHGPVKAKGYPATTHPTDKFIERWDQPGVHDIYRRWRALADAYEPERMFIGEVHVASTERLMDYLGADGLHLAFQFSFLKAEWSLESLRSTIEETLAFAADSDSPASWVLSNHDETRHVTRYAPIDEMGQPDVGRGRARARSLLMVMATLPGTVTLYNGEELGLYEVTDLPDDVRQDPAFFRQPPDSTYKGRDGCRVPLPWTAQRPNAGFTTGEPWLPMPEDWPDLSVEVQAEDPESMLNFYRQTLRLRKATLAGRGEVTVLNLGDALLAYDVQLDGTVHRIVVNLSETGQAVDLEGWTMTLTSSSQAMEANRLLPDGAVWVTKEA